jgi:hypothetical protein
VMGPTGALLALGTDIPALARRAAAYATGTAPLSRGPRRQPDLLLAHVAPRLFS